jgi:hypothetical protein
MASPNPREEPSSTFISKEKAKKRYLMNFQENYNSLQA